MFKSIALVVLTASLVSATITGPQSVNFWKLDKKQQAARSGLIVQDTNFAVQDSEFPEQWFTQPVDHFDKGSTTFGQRYWVNSRHYTPGSNGPVIVLDGGETSGEDRIPFLDKGIVDILCRATGGVGVVLEHRYYGTSVPVSNFSTDSLRWLNNDQALEDSANFMAHVNFTGIDDDLTAPNTPWIYYGGSYAGARAAHMRVLYPELVFGTIASSAVTHASVEMWEYMDVIRRYADETCSNHLVSLATAIDKILGTPLSKPLKSLFGLADLKSDYDFVSTIERTLGEWQGKNWDPKVGSPVFDEYCAALNHPFAGFLDVVDYGLITKAEVRKLLTFPGVSFALFNYAKYVRDNIVSRCPEDMSVVDCFGTTDDLQYQDISLDQEWRLWTFQYCSQWGYLFVAPPNQELPRIISRLHTLENESRICHQAFPPGEKFTMPKLPNVTVVNEIGDFFISADRIAFIDGEIDPWRPMTPHSTYYAPDRSDTIEKPFKIIPGGVHHWDENGLRDLTAEPVEIQQIHEQIVGFVVEWLEGRA